MRAAWLAALLLGGGCVASRAVEVVDPAGLKQAKGTRLGLTHLDWAGLNTTGQAFLGPRAAFADVAEGATPLHPLEAQSLLMLDAALATVGGVAHVPMVALQPPPSGVDVATANQLGLLLTGHLVFTLVPGWTKHLLLQSEWTLADAHGHPLWTARLVHPSAAPLDEQFPELVDPHYEQAWKELLTDTASELAQTLGEALAAP